MVKDKIKSWWVGQWLHLGSVKPTQTYDRILGKLYFDSCAGHVEVRFRDRKLVAPFRDKYVNRFHSCKTPKELFGLYSEMRKDKNRKVRVIYTANIRTRLKGKVCNLLMLN